MRSSLVIVTILASTFASVRGLLSKSEIAAVIDAARMHAMNADDLLSRRREAEVDLRPEQFESVEPDIFEGSPPRASVISINSRLINHIGFQIRSQNLDTTVEEILESDEVRDNHPGLTCPFHFDGKCKTIKYRSLDGSCNNIENPLQAAALTPFPRDMDPMYGEAGEQANAVPRTLDSEGNALPPYAVPRTLDSEGNALPSPREISRMVHQADPKKETNDVEIDRAVVFWGQFMAHMVADRAIASGTDGSRINCCNQQHPTPPRECFNIRVVKNDPFMTAIKDEPTECLGFLRSLETTDINCKYGVREQLNSASSYIDGSAVYGNEEEAAHFLRTFKGGMMAVSEPDQLPYREHVNQIAAKSGFGFVAAGDPRAAEVAPLTGMHTIWVREHNRIAERLKEYNEGWDDETLYQESRRIVVAIIQHVTYNEWLKVIVGNDVYLRHDLEPKSGREYYTNYNTTEDASTRNEVAGAALRFGHSLVNDVYSLPVKDTNRLVDKKIVKLKDTSPAVVKLGEMFFRPNVYVMNEQRLMRGLLRDVPPAMDASITQPLTFHLFNLDFPTGHGADLAAFNIQRGRDHGLQPYNAWRKMFGLPELKSLKTTTKFSDIDKRAIRLLRKIYENADDVDLWTGGVSENPVEGGILGPLFAEMIGRQFRRYKQGDRFWYETDKAPQAFTPGQLKEIRKTTFSRVLCDAFGLDSIQENAFLVANERSNPSRRCRDIVRQKGINLKKWQGEVVELKSLEGNEVPVE